MLNKSLMLLSAMAFCLTSLSILLSDAQQRSLALWNIRAWSAVDQCCRALTFSAVGMHEDAPIVTALMATAMLFTGAISAAVFACFLIPGVAGFLGGLLLAYDTGTLDGKDIQLIALLGAIAGVSLTGVIIGMKGLLLSAAVIVAAALLLPLSVIELVARRVAEYDKGPLVALGVLVAAALTFFKAVL